MTEPVFIAYGALTCMALLPIMVGSHWAVKDVKVRLLH